MKTHEAIVKAFNDSQVLTFMQAPANRITLTDISNTLIREAGRLCESNPSEILPHHVNMVNYVKSDNNHARTDLFIFAISRDHIYDFRQFCQTKREYCRKILAIRVVTTPAEAGLGPVPSQELILKDITDAYYQHAGK